LNRHLKQLTTVHYRIEYFKNIDKSFGNSRFIIENLYFVDTVRVLSTPNEEGGNILLLLLLLFLICFFIYFSFLLNFILLFIESIRMELKATPLISNNSELFFSTMANQVQ
jgi:hypothetical protein